MRCSGPERTDDPGNDSVIFRIYLKWVPKIEEAIGPTIKDARGCVHRPRGESWQLVCTIPRGTRQQVHFIDVNVDGICRADRWDLVKLAPTVWDIPMSVHVPGQLHAYITLLNVPDPAPWEKT